MTDIVLHPNATPVHGFLSTIIARAAKAGREPGGTVLECGAGGAVPPLAIFHRSGFRCVGIDNDSEQLARAREFCSQHGVDIDLRECDMRELPFDDDSFDYVYEHYSMCHLTKRDTATAIGEMHRVLKPGGLCFLGVISADTWPLSLMGQEREPGELWDDDGDEPTVHSAFTDQETEVLAADWQVLSRSKQSRYLGRAAAGMSLEDWMKLRGEAPETIPEDAWCAGYETRARLIRYVHHYFTLEKTATP